MTDHPFPRRYDPAKHQWDLPGALNMLDWNIRTLVALREEFETMWRHQVDWSAGASSGGDVVVSGGRVGPDGAENGSVPATVLARLTQRSSGPARDFNFVLETMVANTHLNLNMVPAWKRLRVAEPAPDVLERKRRAGEGTCANLNCGRYCSGDRKDRIASGRCPNCAAYWSKYGGTKERPHHVCHDSVPIEGCRQCERDQLLAAGHDPNDVVSLVDGARR